MGLAVATVIVATIFTIGFSIWNWHRYQAKQKLLELVSAAQKDPDPTTLITEMASYIRSHPQSDLTEIAFREMRVAEAKLDDFAWDRVVQLEQSTPLTLSTPDPAVQAVEYAHHAYLTAHPDGRHAADSRSRLKELEFLKDDRSFQSCEAIIKAKPLAFALQRETVCSYLKEFPNGRSKDKARSLLSNIDDAADEWRLSNHLREFARLSEAQQFPEAFDVIDKALKDITQVERVLLLRKKANDLSATLEQLDFTACLRPITSDTRDRELQHKACELYLLCYPKNNRWHEVAKRSEIIKTSRLRDSGVIQDQDAKLISDPDRLSRCEQTVISQLPRDDVLIETLPQHYHYRWFDEETPAPIQWVLDLPKVASQQTSQSGGPFSATITIERPATINRAPQSDMRPTLVERIDQELKTVSKSLAVVQEYQVRCGTVKANGFGFQLHIADGMIEINSIVPDSDAYAIGLRVGDRIRAINGMPLPSNTNPDNANAMLDLAPSGAPLIVVRANRRFEVRVLKSTYNVEHCEILSSCFVRPVTVFDNYIVRTNWTVFDPKK